MEDRENGKVSYYTQKESTRITYVLCHNTKKHIILGFVSSIINYKEESFEENHVLSGFYQQIQHMDTIFTDLGCSSQKYKKLVTGTNYFIRAYILLISLEHRPVSILWEQSSGSVNGDRDKLFKLNKTRGCQRYNNSDYYTCDVFTFLNEFFRRMNEKDLLKYTQKK
jgi:hypothetical protein